MKARNDCETACDCVKRASVVLHVRLWKEIFARKHTATHKPTSPQPTHMCHDDTHTHTHTHIHTPINRLWSPLAYGLGGNNCLWSYSLSLSWYLACTSELVLSCNLSSSTSYTSSSKTLNPFRCGSDGIQAGRFIRLTRWVPSQVFSFGTPVANVWTWFLFLDLG